MEKIKSNQAMPIINFGGLGEVIKQLEEVLEPYNSTEKDLIIKELVGKRRAESRKQIQSDAIQGMDFKSILKMITKKIDEEWN